MRTPRCGVRARRTAVFAIVGKNRDRGGVSLAPPRRWIAEGKTEGLLRPYNACLYNPPASLRSAPSLTQGGLKFRNLPQLIKRELPRVREPPFVHNL